MLQLLWVKIISHTPPGVLTFFTVLKMSPREEWPRYQWYQQSSLYDRCWTTHPLLLTFTLKVCGPSKSPRRVHCSLEFWSCWRACLTIIDLNVKSLHASTLTCSVSVLACRVFCSEVETTLLASAKKESVQVERQTSEWCSCFCVIFVTLEDSDQPVEFLRDQ